MFDWLNKKDKPAKEEMGSRPPFRVGEITDLIEGRVDFRIDEIVENHGDGIPWTATGSAIVKLPNATNLDVKPVVDKEGDVENFAIKYTLSGKTHLLLLGSRWTHSDDDGNGICQLVVREVEW